MKENSNHYTQGPAQGILGTSMRILKILVSIVETRLSLATIELEEEKARLIQLMMMVGMAVVFAAFGVMSLLVLIFLVIDPALRLLAVGIATGVLLALALIIAICALIKARKATLLKETRQQLQQDFAELKRNR